MTSTSSVILAPAPPRDALDAQTDRHPPEAGPPAPAASDAEADEGPGTGADGDLAERRRRVRTRLALTGLTLAAFALRLVNPRRLGLDEATSVRQAKLPLGEMLHVLWREDVHPPLHHLVLWADVRLLGDGEIAVRLPSTLMGALLVPLVFVVARDLVDRRTGLIAATLCATAPLAVWYAQEARMYAQFMLLALVAVWAQTRLLRGGGRRWWVVLTLAGTGLVLTHWFAALHLAALHAVFLAVVLRRRGTGPGRRLRRGWLLALGAQALLLAPLAPLALRQLLTNQQPGPRVAAPGLAAVGAMGASPRPSVHSLITNLEWGLFGYQSAQATRCLAAAWPLALLGVLLLLGRQRRPGNRYLVFVAGLPILVVFGLSVVAGERWSLADVRSFAGAVPLLFILVASVMTGVVTTRRAQVVTAGLAAGVMIVALVGQHANAGRLRGDGPGPGQATMQVGP